MAELTSLNIKRAEEAGDCRLVSPVEILENLLSEIKSGEVDNPEMIYIAMRVRSEGDINLIKYPYQAAGGSVMELCGLLTIHLQRMAQF